MTDDSPLGRPAADVVALQIANHMVGNVDSLDVTPTDLAGGIAEITVETTTTAASLLTLSMIDPFWVIQRSAICATDDTGELANDIDVNWPEGSNLWWRLAMVEGGSIDAASSGSGNLTLTFMDRIVCYLQDDWGPLTVVAGATTRAQFIAQLVARIPHSVQQYGVIGEGPSQISFVCPDENIVQPVASSSNASDVDQILGGVTVTGGTTTPASSAQVNVASDEQTRATSARVNKTPGLSSNADSILTSDQATFSTTLADQTGLDVNVIGAWCLAEQSGGAAQTRQAAGNNNWLDIGYFDSGPGAIAFNSAFANPVSGANQTAAFLKGTWGDARSTIRAILKTTGQSPSAQIAAIGSSHWAKNPAYGASIAGTYKELTGQQPSDIATGTGGVPSGSTSPMSTSSSVTSTTTADSSDISQLARGTSENPDEDSWTCIQRLAGDVNWSAWSNAEYLYYMDGQTMIAQQPALYLRLSPDGTFWTAVDGLANKGRVPTGPLTVTQLTFTFDNSAFAYESTHKRRGRVQRRTAIRKPQTASQVQFNMVCDPVEYRAGDVFVFQSAGSINGRWIVEDTTRNIFADTFTQFTLIPATAPYPEPQATSAGVGAPGATGTSSSTDSSGSSSGSGSNASAGGSDVAQVALQALKRQQTSHVFHYAEIRPIQYDILTAASITDDCSGFATACYKNCGLADPNHVNYNGSGYTGTLIAHARNVGGQGNAQAGDLCFFGASETDTYHVNVYVGNGQSVSMGQPGDPSMGPSEQMGPGVSTFLGYYRPDVLGS
jgi:hypothetical protein